LNRFGLLSALKRNPVAGTVRYIMDHGCIAQQVKGGRKLTRIP